MTLRLIINLQSVYKGLLQVTVYVINSLYLTNNKASSLYWYDKYTYVNQRQAFSRPVPSRPGFFSGIF